jgi:hypothetical protein
MFARKARKSPAAAMAAPTARRSERRPGATPFASLSGVPAFGKDSHRAGCPCCTGRGQSKDSPYNVPLPTNPPAATPASVPITRTVTIFPVSVGSSTRSPEPDVTKANAVWNQCGVKVKASIGKCWESDVLDKLPPTDVLNEFSKPTEPTEEEKTMLAYQPGGASVIHAYYVPRMSDGSRGEAFIKSKTPDLPEALVISDAEAVEDTMAHELGHILLSDGGHSSDPDNVMANGDIRNVGVDKLDATQCKTGSTAPVKPDAVAP